MKKGVQHMKRMISLMLVMTLLAGCIPCTAFAEEMTFQADFTIRGREISEEEKAFREWAANLVQQYRDTYCMLEEDSDQFRKVSLPFMKIYDHWGRTIYDRIIKECEGALFAPYYYVAMAKRKFDGSEQSESENIFGVVIDDTAYNYSELHDDPAKRQEIYTWILAEVIRQKGVADPSLYRAEAKIATEGGHYRYDLKTRTMVYDETLALVQERSVEDAKADVLTAVADGLNLAVEAWMAGQNLYDDMKDGMQSVLADAWSKADRESNMDDILDTFKQDMISTLSGTATRAAKEGISMIREKASNEISNALRGILAADLANAYVNRNRNIIGYLRSAYLDNPASLVALFDSDGGKQGYEPRGEFRAAVRTFIDRLEKENLIMMEQMANDQEIANVIMNFTLDETMPLEEVLDDSLILYTVLTHATLDLMQGFADSLLSLLLNVAEDRFARSGPNKEVNSALLTFVIDDIAGELTRRILDGLKSTFEAFVPANFRADEFLDTLKSRVFDESMDGFGAHLVQKGLDLVLKIVFRTPADDDPDGYRKAFELVTERMQSTDARKHAHLQDSEAAKAHIYNDEFLDSWEIGSVIAVILLSFIIEPFSQGLKARTDGFLNETEKRDLDSLLKELSDAVDEVSGEENGMPVDFGRAKVVHGVSALGQLLMMFGQLDKKYPDEKPFDLLANELVNAAMPVAQVSAGNTVGRESQQGLMSGLEHLMKNADFWGYIMDVFLGDTNIEKAMVVVDKAKLYAYREIHPELEITSKEQNMLGDTENAVRASIKENPTLINAVNMFIKLFNSVWEPAKQFAGSAVKAKNSAADAIRHEDEVSLIAQRINAIEQISSALQKPLSVYTRGGVRTGMFNGGSLDRLRTMETRPEDAPTDYKFMNPDEILNPELTPDLRNIKTITDDILTQMNLDAAGMGAYVSLVAGWETFAASDFFTHLVIPNNLLLEKEEAIRRCDLIVDMFNKHDSRYNHAWDSLF